jgi:hypothetical protein
MAFGEAEVFLVIALTLSSFNINGDPNHVKLASPEDYFTTTGTIRSVHTASMCHPELTCDFLSSRPKPFYFDIKPRSESSAALVAAVTDL